MNFFSKLFGAGEQKNMEDSRGVARGKFSFNPITDRVGQGLTVDSMYILYRNQVDIYGCVREISNYVGAGGYELVQDGEVIDDDVVESVLNLTCNFNELKALAVLHFEVGGNAFIEKVRSSSGVLVGYRCLDPRTMYKVVDKHGVVVRYVQRYVSSVVDFDPKDIIHLKNGVDTQNEAFGFSPISTIFYDAKSDVASSVHNYKFFENHAVPANMFVLKDTVRTKEEIRDAMDSIKQQFSGPNNSHKSGVLGGVEKIEQLGMSNKDAQFLELRKFSIEKICASFGVPKVLLGYTEGVNFSNHEGQVRKFVEMTVRPIEDMLARTFTRDLTEELGLVGEIRFKQISLEDVDDVHTRARLGFSTGVMTLNEARTTIGLQPVDGGDDNIIVNGLGAVPLEDVGLDTFTEESAQKMIKILSNDTKASI